MKINYVFRTLSNYIGLSVFVFIGSMHFVQAQVESQLHPNELEFLENGISKANLRYSGIHLKKSIPVAPIGHIPRTCLSVFPHQDFNLFSMNSTTSAPKKNRMSDISI